MGTLEFSGLSHSRLSERSRRLAKSSLIVWKRVGCGSSMPWPITWRTTPVVEPWSAAF